MLLLFVAEGVNLWIRGLHLIKSTNDGPCCFSSGVPLPGLHIKCVMLWDLLIEILMCILIILIEFDKCCKWCVSTCLQSPLLIAIMIIYSLLKWKVNCKSDDDVTFLIHLVLHDSQ